jgi:hypothetical protein
MISPVTHIWIRLQASARCRACGELTPANAAVERLDCTGCGASFTLRAELWENALAEVVDAVRELDANATTSKTFDAQGVTLSLAITASPPSCPQCDAVWAVVPKDGCPSCATEVSVRGFGPGTLVGEDRHLLGGERRAPVAESLSCPGCGSPMSTDGSSRKLACAGCSRETVIPDEIWRRLHAPSSVANWWLATAGSIAAGLRQQIRPFSLAADAGRVYVLGSYGDTPFALFAIDRRPFALAWMIDLDAAGFPDMLAMGTLMLRADELFAFHLLAKVIEVFDAKTGRHLRTLTMPGPLSEAAVDPDGSLICSIVAAAGVGRFDQQGHELSLWSTGFFARVFSGGGSARRMVESGGKRGFGHDGELRCVGGNTIARIGRGGERRWSIDVSDVNVAGTNPAAAADGTTWVVFRTVGGAMTAEQILEHTTAMLSGVEQSASALVRVSADGSKVDVVRRSGGDEYTSLAVTPDGEVWVAGHNQVLRLDANGELLWQQRDPHADEYG